MSLVQKLVTSVLPRSWAEAMQAESRAWMAHCGSCGYERSVWELGGIRWKAAGWPRQWLRCPQCGRGTWHQVRRS